MFEVREKTVRLPDPDPVICDEPRWKSGRRSRFRSDWYMAVPTGDGWRWFRTGPLMKKDGDDYADGREGALSIPQAQVPLPVLNAWLAQAIAERDSGLAALDEMVARIERVVSHASR